MRELGLPFGKYALFGSAPLCVRGLKDCSHDIDIIVTEDVWNEYLKKENWKLKRMNHGSEFLWNNYIELWKDWKPGVWDIEKLIKEVEIIDGLPFVKLKYVVKWKKLLGREKDSRDIELIENYLGK